MTGFALGLLNKTSCGRRTKSKRRCSGRVSSRILLFSFFAHRHLCPSRGYITTSGVWKLSEAYAFQVSSSIMIRLNNVTNTLAWLFMYEIIREHIYLRSWSYCTPNSTNFFSLFFHINNSSSENNRSTLNFSHSFHFFVLGLTNFRQEYSRETTFAGMKNMSKKK